MNVPDALKISLSEARQPITPIDGTVASRLAACGRETAEIADVFRAFEIEDAIMAVVSHASVAPGCRSMASV